MLCFMPGLQHKPALMVCGGHIQLFTRDKRFNPCAFDRIRGVRVPSHYRSRNSFLLLCANGQT